LAERWNRRDDEQVIELRSALSALSQAFDNMLFDHPGEREYDARREAGRLLSVAGIL
jgi:hypothetical protein